MGQSPVVEGTNQLNTFQIGARSIDPSRMTAEQWLTNRQMALISTAAVSRLGTGNVARYPLIDITNAVISRMLLGGPSDRAAYKQHVAAMITKAEKSELMKMLVAPRTPKLVDDMFAIVDSYR